MVGRSDVGWVPEFGGANGRSEVGGRIDLPRGRQSEAGLRRPDWVSARGCRTPPLRPRTSDRRFRHPISGTHPASDIRPRRNPTNPIPPRADVDGCRNSEARTGGRKSEDGLSCPEVGGQMACRRGVPDASTPASDIRPPVPASDFGHASGVRCPTSDFGKVRPIRLPEVRKQRTPTSQAVGVRKLPRAPSLELSVLPNGGGLVLCTLDDAGCSTVTPVPDSSRTGSRSVTQKPEKVPADGAEGARTPDLCNANAALSQLSYSPK